MSGEASLYPRLQFGARLASSLAILTGGLVLGGWLFDVPALKSVVPGLVTMKANTALAFVLAGAALWLLQCDSIPPLRRRIARASAVLIILIGLLTLAEYVTERDLGIDELLFTESRAGMVGTSHPGRMAPATAVGFSLIGLALFLLDLPRGRLVAQLLTLATGLMALISLVGYLYGVAALYAIGPYSSMALHTSMTFLILSAGLLVVRPERGCMAILTNDTAGGMVARRLLPAAVGIPITVGVLTLVGQRAGFYEPAFGVALFATSNLVVFLVLIGLTTGWLSRLDAARKQAQEEINRHSRELEVRVQERTTELALTNRTLEFFKHVTDKTHDPVYWLSPEEGFRFVYVNDAACRHYGYTLEELLRMSVPDWDPNYPLEECEKFWQDLQISKSRTIETLHRRKTGEVVPVEVTTNYVVFDDKEYVAGTIRDISERKQAHQERERLIADLQDALGRIKVLQGILPICLHCKKIRDGNGDWHPVESYVQARSEAEFSHGICPACMRHHYPGFGQKLT